MNAPLSKRLAACADLVPECETVADVGADHGYLGIRLLQTNRCHRVIASDLRQKPLASAKANALRFGAADRMRFVQSDGLESIAPGSFQTLVCAGMGGDCITLILKAAPWLRDGRYTLILQPQSSGNDLRRWLGNNGYEIVQERLVQDGRFLYGVMRVVWGQGRALSPAEQYVSPALQRENDPLFVPYLDRLIRSLHATVAGISRSDTEEDQRKLKYYASALAGITEIRRDL